MILLYLLKCATCKIEFPDHIYVAGGGLFNFLDILKILPNMLNNRNIFGYTIYGNFDIATMLATKITSNLNVRVNLTDEILRYISIYVDQEPENEYSEFKVDSIIPDLDSIVSEFTDNYISYGIGIGLLCIFLIVFFIISLVYFTLFCFCCCCCYNRIDTSKPSVKEIVHFYLSVILIGTSVIFMYISSINLNMIVNFAIKLPELLDVVGPTLYSIILPLNESINEVSDSFVSGISNVMSTINQTFIGDEGLLRYVNNKIDNINYSLIGNAEDTIYTDYLLYTIEVSKEKDPNIVEEDVPTVKYALDAFNDFIKSDGTGLFNLKEVTSIVRNATRVEFPFDEITSTVIEALDHIDEKITSVASKISFDNIFDDDFLKSLVDNTIFNFDYIRGQAETISKYIENHKTNITFVLFLLPLFFIVLLYVWISSFHSHNSCAYCIASCSVCYPCLSFVIHFSFGVVFTFLSLVLVIGSSFIFKSADNIINNAIDIIYRQIYVPQLTFFNKIGDKYRYFTEISTDPFTLSFAEETTPISYFVKADPNSNLDETFGFSDFLQLSLFVNYMEKKARRIIDSSQLGEFLSDILGERINYSVSSFDIDFSEILNFDPLRLCASTLNFSDANDSSSNVTENKMCTPDMDETSFTCYGFNYLDMVYDLMDESKNITYNLYCSNACETNESNSNYVICSFCFNAIEKAYSLNRSFSYFLNHYVNNTHMKLNSFIEEFSNFTNIYENAMFTPLNNSLPIGFRYMSERLTDSITNIMSSIPVNRIRGPISYILNIYYNVAVVCISLCIVCHLLLIGFVISTCSLCHRRQGMYSEEKQNMVHRYEVSEDDNKSEDSAFKGIDYGIGMNGINTVVYNDKKPLRTESLKDSLLKNFYLEHQDLTNSMKEDDI